MAALFIAAIQIICLHRARKPNAWRDMCDTLRNRHRWAATVFIIYCSICFIASILFLSSGSSIALVLQPNDWSWLLILFPMGKEKEGKITHGLLSVACMREMGLCVCVWESMLGRFPQLNTRGSPTVQLISNRWPPYTASVPYPAKECTYRTFKERILLMAELSTDGSVAFVSVTAVFLPYGEGILSTSLLDYIWCVWSCECILFFRLRLYFGATLIMLWLYLNRYSTVATPTRVYSFSSFLECHCVYASSAPPKSFCYFPTLSSSAALQDGPSSPPNPRFSLRSPS